MHIDVQNLGKRYRKEWIFHQMNYQWQGPGLYAISGRNGAGKSTLLQILSGYRSPSQGQVRISLQGQELPRETWYAQLAYVGPYIELIEEFTLLEHLRFQGKFKAWLPTLDEQTLLDILDLPTSAQHRPLAQFSSGMKQRLKLLLALCADTSLLLLDEPTITLDRQGMDWYQMLLKRFAPNRLCLIASNVEADYEGALNCLDLADYKGPKKSL